VFVQRYSQEQASEAVACSLSYAESLRRLDLCATGGNWRTLRVWVQRWAIATDPFDPDVARRESLRGTPQPLEEILVKGSSYSRNHLKVVGAASGHAGVVKTSCVEWAGGARF